MKCPICQSDNRPGVQFCENCGAKLVEEASPEIKSCPVCGKENRPEVRFCEYCGAELVPEPVTTEIPENMQPCPGCGKAIPLDVAACEYCGVSLEAEAVPPTLETKAQTCPVCGKENCEGIQFCEYCGSSLEPQVQPAKPPEERQRCPVCGEENRAVIQFCEYCGGNLVAESPLPDDIQPSQICPACGSANPAELVFCQSCGEILQVESEAKKAPKKKSRKLLYLIPAGAILVFSIICVVIFVTIRLNQANRAAPLPVIPNEPTQSSPIGGESQQGPEGAVQFPDYGDLKNLTTSEATTIGDAFIDQYYPDLDLATLPDVEYSVSNGDQLINVVYASEATTDSGVVIEQVIIININADEKTVTILETN